MSILDGQIKMWFDSHNYIGDNYDIHSHSPHLKLLKRGIFLDTAPLFILVVGHYDKINKTNFVRKFQSKRRDKNLERSYQVHDYDYLLAFLNSIGVGKCKLFITPHVFTEFIKHLWEFVDDKEHFRKILKESLGTKWYIEEIPSNYVDFLSEEYLLDKKLEIGDTSITILAKNNDYAAITILTDDLPFAEISDKSNNFLTIYYQDIWSGTMNLDPKNIPIEFLNEPSK